ncbi:MAG: DUF3267 domain-containing protein [Clostridiales bacterium]|nr:DUF3267 domain-containing protein [Clostridiales bacterium]
MKTYEKELPQGYVEAKVVDAKSKKVGIIFSLIALVVTVATLVITWFALFGQYDESFWEIGEKYLVLENPFANIARLAILIVAIPLYIILHELVHGIVYKLLTRQKLKFGLTFTVAYCGVPDIYVYRTTALLSLLAPFIVFLPVFIVPMFFLKNNLDIFLFAVMLGQHVGGCVGDLYDTALYTFKFRSPDTLMRDTGPKQTFYVKQSSEVLMTEYDGENI